MVREGRPRARVVVEGAREGVERVDHALNGAESIEGSPLRVDRPSPRPLLPQPKNVQQPVMQ